MTNAWLFSPIAGRAGALPALATTVLSIAAMAAVSLLPAAASAQTPAHCAATAGRADDLRLERLEKSLSDLALAVAGGQERHVTWPQVTLLKGACAADVRAFQMSLLLFEDDAVFGATAPGRIEHLPALTESSLRIHPAAVTHPLLPESQFVMASKVDATNGSAGSRTLDVGLWRSGNAYIVAAYPGRDGAFGRPVELLRSTQPIRSVTYFPAPDANAGTLGLVLSDGRATFLVGLSWHHAALSKELFSGR